MLPLLTSTTGPAATARLAADLRAALARTAARGDTCRVRGAADDVRLAANLLSAGATDEAGQALRHARSALVDASAAPPRIGHAGPAEVVPAGSPEPRWEAR